MIHWNLSLVKEYAKKYGYTVTSDSFHSSKEKVAMVCPTGHAYQVKWSAFASQEQRCRRCYLDKQTTLREKNQARRLKRFL